jgi:hypothetical protein
MLRDASTRVKSVSNKRRVQKKEEDHDRGEAHQDQISLFNELRKCALTPSELSES